MWRIRASNTRLVCAVGSRNGTEETKLLVLDFDSDSSHYDSERPARSLSALLSVASTSSDEEDLFLDHQTSGSSSHNALDAFICEN